MSWAFTDDNTTYFRVLEAHRSWSVTEISCVKKHKTRHGSKERKSKSRGPIQLKYSMSVLPRQYSRLAYSLGGDWNGMHIVRLTSVGQVEAAQAKRHLDWRDVLFENSSYQNAGKCLKCVEWCMIGCCEKRGIGDDSEKYGNGDENVCVVIALL